MAVSFDKQRGKFKAAINTGTNKEGRIYVYIGHYPTREEAQLEVDEWFAERERYREWCEEYGLPY